jgi:hypothetical protein
VTHIYNPSYSGSSDQEDHRSKEPRQIVLEIISQKIHHRKGLVEWLKVEAAHYVEIYKNDGLSILNECIFIVHEL